MSELFEAFAEFNQLLEVFARDLATAKAIATPNVQDTLEIKAAIVGFSYHSKTEDWGRNHLVFVGRHISGASSLEGRELIFSCLCFGYLLGLFQANKITEQQFQLAEAQLPGFIMLKAGRI
jgi:hypothetical protein